MHVLHTNRRSGSHPGPGLKIGQSPDPFNRCAPPNKQYSKTDIPCRHEHITGVSGAARSQKISATFLRSPVTVITLIVLEFFIEIRNKSAMTILKAMSPDACQWVRGKKWWRENVIIFMIRHIFKGLGKTHGEHIFKLFEMKLFIPHDSKGIWM